MAKSTVRDRVSTEEMVARCCDLVAAMATNMTAVFVATPEEGMLLVEKMHDIVFMAEELAKVARDK